ncbi:hypothetical protein ACIP1T_09025 [Pseudomonas japonica]|uniref:hypothetical protein n=1 Tax=Pseudomonas japonica TaxID=256466 RepID=UPI00382FB9F9
MKKPIAFICFIFLTLLIHGCATDQGWEYWDARRAELERTGVPKEGAPNLDAVTQRVESEYQEHCVKGASGADSFCLEAEELLPKMFFNQRAHAKSLFFLYALKKRNMNQAATASWAPSESSCFETCQLIYMNQVRLERKPTSEEFYSAWMDAMDRLYYGYRREYCCEGLARFESTDEFVKDAHKYLPPAEAYYAESFIANVIIKMKQQHEIIGQKSGFTPGVTPTPEQMDRSDGYYAALYKNAIDYMRKNDFPQRYVDFVGNLYATVKSAHENR